MIKIHGIDKNTLEDKFLLIKEEDENEVLIQDIKKGKINDLTETGLKTKKVRFLTEREKEILKDFKNCVNISIY